MAENDVTAVEANKQAAIARCLANAADHTRHGHHILEHLEQACLTSTDAIETAHHAARTFFWLAYCQISTAFSLLTGIDEYGQFIPEFNITVGSEKPEA